LFIYNLHQHLIVAPRPLLGNILVVIAQFFLAGMFVYEEKILNEYKIKVMEIVGWEGVWGMIISLVIMSIFFLLPGDDYGSLENPIQASLQIMNNHHLFIGMIVSSVVIGPFNYFGTNLTKYASAMHRCLIDSSRMCIVWAIAVCCQWEMFTCYQAIGYSLIMVGNLLYYSIISIDKYFELPEDQKKGDYDIISNALGLNDTTFLKDSKNAKSCKNNFDDEEVSKLENDYPVKLGDNIKTNIGNSSNNIENNHTQEKSEISKMGFDYVDAFNEELSKSFEHKNRNNSYEIINNKEN
jgi:hypothetical protein